jgi:AcrR family transcriptional regulator
VVSPNPERRSERARRAILDAAFELSQDPGFQATSVEAIAKRAGVGKQTIYRWWPSKGAVVLEAMSERAGASFNFPDTGDLAADLDTQMTLVAKLLAGELSVPFTGVIAAAQGDPDLARTVLEKIINPRVVVCKERLESAQRQGQLRMDVDLDEVIELIYGPLYYRLLLRNQPITADQPAGILDLTLNGLHPAAPPPPQAP